jgi:hypothetical protein
MNKTQFKEAISAKITDRKTLNQLLYDAGVHPSYLARTKQDQEYGGVVGGAQDHYAVSNIINCLVANETVGPAPEPGYPYPNDVIEGSRNTAIAGNNIPATAWWWVREACRFAAGVYQPLPEQTRALLRDYGLSKYCVHLSVEGGATMIAYTPDARAGETDKQLRTTLGKFLRKHLLLVTDHAIADMEAAFRAEMSDEIEIIPPDRIAEAYVQGPSSCMTHHKAHWNLKHHPAEVYNAPGFGLAVLRNGAGQISARSLVWVNPGDPTDKRYLRVYGDAALKRRLERNGYRCANFAGARIKAIPVHNEPDVYVMPYIDGPGGASEPNNPGRYVALVSDTEIELLSYERRKLVNKIAEMMNGDVNKYSFMATGTSGRATLKKVDFSLLDFTCKITGEKYSAADVAPVIAYIDGGFWRVNPQNLPDTFVSCHAKVTEMSDGSPAPSDTARVMAALDHTFRHGVRMLDTPATREHFGFKPLGSRYTDQRWAAEGEAVLDLLNGCYILVSDAVRVVIDDGGEAVAGWTHKDDTAGMVRLHNVENNVRAYATSGSTYYTTNTGRKVHPKLHSVVQCWNGVWAFTRSVVEESFAGADIYRLSSDPAPTPATHLLSEYPTLAERMIRRLRVCTGVDKRYVTERQKMNTLINILRAVSTEFAERFAAGRSIEESVAGESVQQRNAQFLLAAYNEAKAAAPAPMPPAAPGTIRFVLSTD